MVNVLNIVKMGERQPTRRCKVKAIRGTEMEVSEDGVLVMVLIEIDLAIYAGVSVTLRIRITTKLFIGVVET